MATKAKGIYKPAWSKYALSVRQTLEGPYNDLEPKLRPDGTWVYPYYQENEDPAARDEEYTNLALMECWRDRVPIGVMRQVKAKPDPRYEILGLALVSGWDDGYFFLEGFSATGSGHSPGPTTEIDYLRPGEVIPSEGGGAFDLSGIVDARKRTLSNIISRQGQSQFRRLLLRVYDGRCAISSCDAEAALEAAHITPYLGPLTNHAGNGLLLRSDIHTFFDLGLLAVEPANMKVVLSSALQVTVYRDLAGVKVRVPMEIAYKPNPEALARHREWAGL